MPKNCKELRVAYLTNNVTAHSIQLLCSLSSQVKELIILTPTFPEQHANSKEEGEGRFRIIRQRNLSLRRVRYHPQGYSQSVNIHIPYDTLFHLMVQRPDAIISLEFGSRTLQALIYRMIRPASRLVVWAPLSERTEQGRGRVRIALRKLIIRNTDAVVVNGSSGFRYIRQLGGEANKIFTIPYVTDIELFGTIPPTRPRQEVTRLLYVGQLIERKGLIPFVKTLIRWVKVHPKKKIELELAGEGPIRRQLEELPLPNNLDLSFLGKINYYDLPSYYAKAGFFVFPTLGDEWGVVVNEAMMTGLPVLGSIYSQAVEELVNDGFNGWIFTPYDSQSIYRALDLIMTTSFADLQAMRVQARLTALKLSPEYAAQKFAAALTAAI